MDLGGGSGGVVVAEVLERDLRRRVVAVVLHETNKLGSKGFHQDAQSKGLKDSEMDLASAGFDSDFVDADSGDANSGCHDQMLLLAPLLIREFAEKILR